MSNTKVGGLEYKYDIWTSQSPDVPFDAVIAFANYYFFGVPYGERVSSLGSLEATGLISAGAPSIHAVENLELQPCLILCPLFGAVFFGRSGRRLDVVGRRPAATTKMKQRRAKGRVKRWLQYDGVEI